MGNALSESVLDAAPTVVETAVTTTGYSDADFSAVIPNFLSLPAPMQKWVKANLQSLMDAAIESVESERDQADHLGMSVAGHSYFITGKDSRTAIMGDRH